MSAMSLEFPLPGHVSLPKKLISNWREFPIAPWDEDKVIVPLHIAMDAIKSFLST